MQNISGFQFQTNSTKVLPQGKLFGEYKANLLFLSRSSLGNEYDYSILLKELLDPSGSLRGSASLGLSLKFHLEC